MVNVEAWVSHLNNPLTLIGFVFFVAASILALRPSEKLPQKTVPMLFLLALVIIIGSFWLAFLQIQPQSTPVQPTEKNTSEKNDSNKTKIEDKNIGSISVSTKGSKSPAVVATSGNVTINY